MPNDEAYKGQSSDTELRLLQTEMKLSWRFENLQSTWWNEHRDANCSQNLSLRLIYLNKPTDIPNLHFLYSWNPRKFSIYLKQSLFSKFILVRWISKIAPSKWFSNKHKPQSATLNSGRRHTLCSSLSRAAYSNRSLSFLINHLRSSYDICCNAILVCYTVSI
jgi:hypothetical protein